MSETKKPMWPKLSTGVTDWESVFEDPEKGLITRITKINTVNALRDSMIMVIKRLHTRDDDAALLEHLTQSIADLIPNDASEDKLPDFIAAASKLLRDIKSDRTRKAEAYVRDNEHANKFERQVSRGEGEPEGFERRHQDDEDQELDLSDESKPNNRVKFALGGTALLAVIVGALVFFLNGPGEEKIPVKQFIDQMADAANGNIVDQHIYGGLIKTGEQGGRAFVSANKIPKKACESIAWVLVNRGTAVINQVRPSHITPTVLKELCAKNGDRAIIYWFPKKVAGDTKAN